MVVFIGGTFAAQYMARSRSSVGMQYAGLALYVMLYTLLFMPILTIASAPVRRRQSSCRSRPAS